MISSDTVLLDNKASKSGTYSGNLNPISKPLEHQGEEAAADEAEEQQSTFFKEKEEFMAKLKRLLDGNPMGERELELFLQIASCLSLLIDGLFRLISTRNDRNYLIRTWRKLLIPSLNLVLLLSSNFVCFGSF